MKPKLKPKLEIELVPSTAWYSNLRLILDENDWDIIRKSVYKKANYCCEICGSKGEKHPVEAHEVWGYYISLADSEKKIADGTHIQELLYVQALCPLCHEAKHIGLAQVLGFGERAKQTLMRVNGWNAQETEEYVRKKFAEWSERSRHGWRIEIDEITKYGIPIEKYQPLLHHSKNG